MECPICKAALTEKSDPKANPFCSMRCKAVDLGKWMAEDYTISKPLFPQHTDDQDNNFGTKGAKNGNSDLLH